MLFRFFSFLTLQLAGVAAGWWLGGRWGALAGLALAGLLWVTLDLLRGASVLRWLKQGEASGAPALRGLWGEVSDRTRRLLRQREQQTPGQPGTPAGVFGGDPGVAQRGRAAGQDGLH